MSRSLGPALTPELLARFSQADLPSRLGTALPLVTVDARGRPHPMLLSYLEVLAVAPDRLRVALGAASRSAANLRERRWATLLVLEADLAVYVKCGAQGEPLRAGDLVRFDLAVEDVLEDAAGGAEAGIRLTGGVSYGPPQRLDDDGARATLALLRQGDPAPAGRPGTGSAGR